jgi:hypothetical protein
MGVVICFWTGLAKVNNSLLHALKGIYDSANGDNWDFSGVPWNFENNSDPCENHWQGVLCDEVNISLLELKLIGLNMSAI